MSESDYDRLSRRQAIAAAIVGVLFALAMLAVFHFVLGEPPASAPPSTPMVLPAEDRP